MFKDKQSGIDPFPLGIRVEKEERETRAICVAFSFGYRPTDWQLSLKTIYLHRAIGVICNSASKHPRPS